MRKIVYMVAACCLASLTAQASAPDDIQAAYGALPAGGFSAQRGERLWVSESVKGRSCADCHGRDPRQPGRHQRTRKPIDPMALSVSSGRFQDPEKVEKWFRRNCKWTWGRECTATEKGDLLEYLYRGRY